MSEEIAAAVVETPVSAPPVEAAAAEAPVERSMDDTLAATMAEIKARRPEQGDDGKFVPKAGAQTATPKAEVPGSPQAAAPDPAQPVIEAPQSLSADVKAQWSALPPTVQKFWAEREGEIHKKITTDGERLKSLGAFEELTTGIQDRLRQVNAPAPEYFRRLAAADQMLASDGIRGLQQIAQMYGIDLRAVAQQSIGQPQAPMDPQFNALASELGAIKQTLQQREQAEQAARLSESEKKIEAFKKNAPHFDKVEALMTKLYEPGMDLETLYAMATKAHPEVSALISAEAEAAAKAKALEEQKAEQAKAAKLATLGRKPGSVGTAVKPGASWEDTMAATHRGIRARA